MNILTHYDFSKELLKHHTPSKRANKILSFPHPIVFLFLPLKLKRKTPTLLMEHSFIFYWFRELVYIYLLLYTRSNSRTGSSSTQLTRSKGSTFHRHNVFLYDTHHLSIFAYLPRVHSLPKSARSSMVSVPRISTKCDRYNLNCELRASLDQLSHRKLHYMAIPICRAL